uniref:Tub domain-containing protein n=1 Tax=Taenia asiatica TaxID=60517 RepID=A0A0R3VXL5_TAEAS
LRSNSDPNELREQCTCLLTRHGRQLRSPGWCAFTEAEKAKNASSSIALSDSGTVHSVNRVSNANLYKNNEGGRRFTCTLVRGTAAI